MSRRRDCNETMNPKLRVALHQQMHVIGHDFHFHNLGTSSIADFANDLFQRFIDWRQKNLPAIFRAPDYMKFTGVDHVAVGFVRHFGKGERARMFALSSLS